MVGYHPKISEKNSQKSQKMSTEILHKSSRNPPDFICSWVTPRAEPIFLGPQALQDLHVAQGRHQCSAAEVVGGNVQELQSPGIGILLMEKREDVTIFLP